MQTYPPPTNLSVNEKNPCNPLTPECDALFLPVKFTTCLPISHHIRVWLILSDWRERTDINHLQSCLASHTVEWQPKHCVTQTDDKRDRESRQWINSASDNSNVWVIPNVWRCRNFYHNYWIILHQSLYKHWWSSEDEANWLLVDTLTSSLMPLQAYHFSFLGKNVSTTIEYTVIGLTFGFHGAQKINADDFSDQLTEDHLEQYFTTKGDRHNWPWILSASVGSQISTSNPVLRGTCFQFGKVCWKYHFLPFLKIWAFNCHVFQVFSWCKHILG